MCVFLLPRFPQHAPIALGAAGARVIVAQTYARIFFRNSIATGEVCNTTPLCICEIHDCFLNNLMTSSQLNDKCLSLCLSSTLTSATSGSATCAKPATMYVRKAVECRVLLV